MTVLDQQKRTCRPAGEVVGADPCGLGYRRSCSCGWRGPITRSDARAEAAWQAHAYGGWTALDQARRRGLAA